MILMKAVPFSLPDQKGMVHTLTDYRGKWIILYFYPKDDTPGCTKEACGFRDIADELKKYNTVILGVSKDGVASHERFAKKYHLNFPLLSDESKKIINAYGAWGKKKFMGREYEGIKRTTVLIDPQGDVKKTYEHVNPLIHTGQVLDDIASLE